MDLIDRYILAVKQALPNDKRDEIGKELKANLQDEIDGHYEQSQAKQSESKVIESVLEKHGHPELSARLYYKEPALVSSANMRLYKRVLYHAAAALFVYALLKTSLLMLQDESINPFRLIFQSVGIFMESVAWLFLVLTVLFYYLGKTIDLNKWQYGRWSVKSLPEGALIKIKASDTISDLITNSFILLVLWTPLWMNESLYQQQLVSLAPAAEYWRIILTVLCVQSLIQALYRFTQTYWRKSTSFAYLCDLLVFAFASLFLALTNDLLILSPELAANTDLNWLLNTITQSSHYILFSISGLLLFLAFFEYKRWIKLSA